MAYIYSSPQPQLQYRPQPPRGDLPFTEPYLLRGLLLACNSLSTSPGKELLKLFIDGAMKPPAEPRRIHKRRRRHSHLRRR